MQKTTLLKIAGLMAALPLALLPVKAQAFDNCPPAHQYSAHGHSGHGGHGGYSSHAKFLWPGDRPRVGQTYIIRHSQYVARPVHVVQVRLVGPARSYHARPSYRHGYHH